MIYFAKLRNGAIKIGTTVNLAGRLTAHGYASRKQDPGRKITEVIGILVGSYGSEQEIHDKFRDLRIRYRPQGTAPEHFRAAPELMEFIAANCRKPDLLDYVPESGGTPEEIRIFLDPDEGARFRQFAADRGLTTVGLARHIILGWLGGSPSPSPAP